MIQSAAVFALPAQEPSITFGDLPKTFIPNQRSPTLSAATTPLSPCCGPCHRRRLFVASTSTAFSSCLRYEHLNVRGELLFVCRPQFVVLIEIRFMVKWPTDEEKKCGPSLTSRATATAGRVAASLPTWSSPTRCSPARSSSGSRVTPPFAPGTV